MPGQEISQPNPPPLDSQLSDRILQDAVKLNTKDYLNGEDLNAIKTFRRAADYIAAGESSPDEFLSVGPTLRSLQL